MIETPRTVLRPFRPDDVDALVELDSDPEVMRYISGGPATPRSVYADILLPQMLDGPDTRPGMGYLVVELREDRSFIGWAHLRPDSHDPEWAEIGYRLRRSHWGRGLATEVALALMTHAFDTLGYSTVTARTMPANIASRRVMEKCGLRCVGESQFLERDFGVFKWPASPALFYMGRKT